MTPSRIKGLCADAALTSDGWIRNVSIYFDDAGLISSFRAGFMDPDLPEAVGPVIPGMVNIHSHAFQRGMVGKTQSFSDPNDDFWSWRRAMYDFVATLTPESYRIQAEALYREMLAQGYTTVCEFHYIHNESDGRSYEEPAAMSLALIEAAESSGIRLCLLPVLYMYGGFDGRRLEGGQRRFGNSIDSFVRLMESLDAVESERDQLTIGYAPHSLRAVSTDGLKMMLDHRNDRRASSPVHIHVAEQEAEVDVCLSENNARPVEFLYDVARVDNNWCLIHATHITPDEINKIAESGSIVGLCPTTESDLGDGVFPLRQFVQAGGRYGIGSDSNVSVSPGEEIRCLESMQRSSMKVRNVDGLRTKSGVATIRYQTAVSAGQSVCGSSSAVLRAGSPADIVILNPESDLLVGKSPDEMLNAHILSGSARSIHSVLVAGRPVASQSST